MLLLLLGCGFPFLLRVLMIFRLRDPSRRGAPM
jgi:hypothetical protein